MSNKLNRCLPLEFQKLNIVAKQKKVNRGKYFTTVNFYQSTKIKPEGFYKPISKIINFNFEK